jgi:hypothetical protein
MKYQICLFLLTLVAVSSCYAVMFLCSARFALVMATGMAALWGPFSGLLWTNDLSSGLVVIGVGLGAVLGVVAVGNVVFRQPVVRSGAAIIAAMLWFGFGAYGIMMLE